MRTGPFLCLFATLAAGACSRGGRATSTTTPLDSAVYMALLDSVGTAGGVVVRDSTIPWPISNRNQTRDEMLASLGHFTGASPALAADFLRANHRPKALPKGFSLRRPAYVVPEKELPLGTRERGPSPAEWREFARRFNGAQGFQTLSAVGYDAERQNALVAYWRGCGALCGYELLVVMAREGNGWRVARVVTTMVS